MKTGVRLFESKDSRERRLYREAYTAISRSLTAGIGNRRQRDIYLSWFAAASAMAEEVAGSITCLRKTVDSRDSTQATRICQVLVLPMASVWFRSFDRTVNPKSDERLHLRTTTINTIASLLNDTAPEIMKDFLNLDIQYNYEADLMETREKSDVSGGQSRYPIFIISKLSSVTGFGDYIDWSKQTFPVTQDGDLVFINSAQPYGELGHDLNGAIALEMSIPFFGAEMFRALTAAGSDG